MSSHAPQEPGPRRAAGARRSRAPQAGIRAACPDSTWRNRRSRSVKGPLKRDQLLDALTAKRQQRGKLGVVERSLFRRRLNLHELAGTGHDDIHVYFGLRIFLIAEVQHRNATDYADAGGRDEISNWRPL